MMAPRTGSAGIRRIRRAHRRACGNAAMCEPQRTRSAGIRRASGDAAMCAPQRTRSAGIRRMLLLPLLLLPACVADAPHAHDAVDGAPLRLVEQLAIGEELGAEQYLFGSISAAWATPEMIYVVDRQVPAVRAFGHDGAHRFDIGRTGQGPGEFNVPAGLAVTDDGRVAIADLMNARINFYAADGTFLEDWALPSPKSAQGITLTDDGEVLTESWDQAAERQGMQRAGPDGAVGEPLFPPLIEFTPPTLTLGRGTEMLLPFAPSYSWTYAPGGEFVAGTGDRYVLVVAAPDGSTRQLRRQVEAVPVDGEEAAFRAELATAALRFMLPGATIGAADLPATKPFFTRIHTDRAGRAWVVRPGAARPDPHCDDLAAAAMPRLRVATGSGTSFQMDGKPAPLDATRYAGRCLTDSLSFDLFDLRSGTFIGTLPAPEPGFKAPLYADAQVTLAAVADEYGTLRLKVYRLAAD